MEGRASKRGPTKEWGVQAIADPPYLGSGPAATKEARAPDTITVVRHFFSNQPHTLCTL